MDNAADEITRSVKRMERDGKAERYAKPEWQLVEEQVGLLFAGTANLADADVDRIMASSVSPLDTGNLAHLALAEVKKRRHPGDGETG